MLMSSGSHYSKCEIKNLGDAATTGKENKSDYNII